MATIATSLMKVFLRVIILFSNGTILLTPTALRTLSRWLSKVRDDELIRWYLGTLQGINAAENLRPADS